LTAVRDYLHVDDVADAYALLLQRGRPRGVQPRHWPRGDVGEIHTRLEQLLGVAPKREVDSSQVRKEARPYLVGDAAKLARGDGMDSRALLDDILKRRARCPKELTYSASCCSAPGRS